MQVVVALDQGTTSSRALVFDAAGTVLAVAQEEFAQHFPQPGWVEHEAEEIWQSQAQVIAQAVAAAGVAPGDIAAVGIANQRETTLVWDRQTGVPIHRAIVWQDRRTAAHCDRLQAEGHGAAIQAKTGLIVDAYFSASKIAWLLNNVDGARARAEAGELAFGTIDTWLAWKLSGGRLHITDASNASRTLLYNIHQQQWDRELLELFDFPASLLPEVRPSSQVYGEITAIPELAGAPLAGMAGDQQAATFGQLCLQPGMAKNTYGTGCFMLLNTGAQAQQSANQLLTTIACQRDGRTDYALEGSVFVGGAIVQWLRDGLGIIESATQIEALAASVSDNGGVYLVPALAGLGAPYWDPYARGTIVGLTGGSTAGHIARAALEGIAFQVADLARALDADAGAPMAQLRVDGGAAANDLLLQFQADLLQIPVVRPTTLETTALGAAYLAGLAVGYWPSTAALADNWQIDRTFEPQRTAVQVEELQGRWSEAVGRSRHWASSS
ncbi:MAG: glycerol kinase GlpK [Candidatus Latescibacteria bacterium]|nr:glycerol kinase GlpK [Candidatus Latescibacterota bacterium]